MICVSLRIAAFAIGVAAVLGYSGNVLAVTQCVSTAAGLQTALTTAQGNNQPNYIKLVKGTYTLTGTLSVSISDKQNLIIEGGYASTPCGGAPTDTPDLTIITGANVAGTNAAFGTGGGGMTIRNLTFTQLKPNAGTHAIVISNNSSSDQVLVENIAVKNNSVQGISDNVLALFTYGGLMFRDSIVHDNNVASAAVYVYANYPGLPLTIVNNTIANNASAGLWINAYSPIPLALFNNILWGNAPTDLRLEDSRVLAMNNTWNTQFFDAGSTLMQESANNDNNNPLLQSDYRLDPTSPAVNSGLPTPMLWAYTDAAENLRVQGSAPDRGAYETIVDDRALWVVNSNEDTTQATDSTVTCNPGKKCTLRQAILRANDAGPSQINFHLGSTCNPALYIQLNSPLPPIAVPVFIDGYSQPGAAANSVGTATGIISSNGTICINVLGGSVDNALSVSDSAPSNTHLEVRGLEFGGFTTAVQLSGGNGHWLHGNLFYSFFLGPVHNGVGVLIDGGAADTVGGPTVPDYNFISYASGVAGIHVQGTQTMYHTIVNNGIGSDATGTATTFGNANSGILLDNTYSNIVKGNWIVANGGDGIRLNGAVNSLIQSNIIGSNFTAGLGNGNAGVHLLAGADENWIGPMAMGGSGGANDIEYNGSAGVFVDLDASYYNQVYNSKIAFNGGLAIDLALLGPTANVGTEDTGPNDLLHKPILTSADYATSGPTINVKGSIAAEPNKPNEARYVSIYANYRCGDATVLLGTVELTVPVNGLLPLDISVPAPSFSPAYITATAADNTAGSSNVSEISNCKKLSPSDDIFNDGYDAY